MSWYGETNDSSKENEVLNALQPHNNLEILSIKGFRGTKFPDWVSHRSFLGMVEITVRRCINCYFLPPFGQLPSLKRLRISEMPGVVSIGDELCGTCSSNNFQPFPSLEELRIVMVDSWEKWSFIETEQGEILFPCLKILHILFCKKLNVGLAAGSHFPFLETVKIYLCRSMVSVFPTSQSGEEIDTKYPHSVIWL